MTNYLHVVIDLSDKKEPFLLFSDLSEKELRQKFIRKYKIGKHVMKGSQFVDLSKVTSVTIIETKELLRAALERLQKESQERIERLNRESQSLVIVSAGRGWKDEDIVDCGREVTGLYVSGPPGQGSRLVQVGAILRNPWVTGIGGGIILIFVGAIVKKWLGL